MSRALDAHEAKLRAAIERAGWAVDHLLFDASCHSVAEASEASGAPVDSFIKSICMMDGVGRLIVTVVKGEDRASTKRVMAALSLEAPPRLATPDEMLALSGYPAGGTPPFGFDAVFLVDERVLERPMVWGGGGSSRALVRVSPKVLVDANGGAVARVRK